jgi:hypothetical protein
MTSNAIPYVNIALLYQHIYIPTKGKYLKKMKLSIIDFSIIEERTSHADTRGTFDSCDDIEVLDGDTFKSEITVTD